MEMSPSHAMFRWIILVAFFAGVHLSATMSVRNSISTMAPDPDDLDSIVADGNFSLITTNVTFDCPSPNGKFAHERYCENYYYCQSGIAVGLYHCPTEANFLFSDLKSECDYAYEVFCGDRIRPENVPPYRPPTLPTSAIPSTSTLLASTTTPTTALTGSVTAATTVDPIANFNCSVNGAYPHPKYCEKYIDCWNGTAQLLNCPLDYLFDTVYFGCSPPRTVDCGDRIIGGEFECPPDAPPEKLYPDPLDCASFFSCVDGIPLKQTCSDNLLFNKDLQVCDYPINVDCSDRWIPPGISISPDTDTYQDKN